MKYPPFCDIIVIGFNSTSETEIIKTSDKVYSYLKEEINNKINSAEEQEYKIFKPMPSPIDKIQIATDGGL